MSPSDSVVVMFRNPLYIIFMSLPVQTRQKSVHG